MSSRRVIRDRETRLKDVVAQVGLRRSGRRISHLQAARATAEQNRELLILETDDLAVQHAAVLDLAHESDDHRSDDELDGAEQRRRTAGERKSRLYESENESPALNGPCSKPS